MCQWPYSAFGDNKPTGVLQATPSPSTNSVALQVTKPALVYNPRYPGQYFDEETGLLQNHFRSYQAAQGRYTQADPIGLGGGLNRFGYVGGNPLSNTDPEGLDWYRLKNSSQPYGVGREGNPIVWPGSPISQFIEQCVPAGRTFGEIHDARVDEMISRGVPDWRANIPTMPGAYLDAVKQETANSLLLLERSILNLYRQ